MTGFHMCSLGMFTYILILKKIQIPSYLETDNYGQSCGREKDVSEFEIIDLFIIFKILTIRTYLYFNDVIIIEFLKEKLLILTSTRAHKQTNIIDKPS